MALYNDYIIAKRYVEKADQAHKRGIQFALSFVEYRALFNTKRCFFSGKPMVHYSYQQIQDYKRANKDQFPDDMFTLDRVNNKLGYTKENTVACCHLINYAKNAVEILSRGKSDDQLLDNYKLVNKAFDKMIRVKGHLFVVPDEPKADDVE